MDLEPPSFDQVDPCLCLHGHTPPHGACTSADPDARRGRSRSRSMTERHPNDTGATRGRNRCICPGATPTPTTPTFSQLNGANSPASAAKRHHMWGQRPAARAAVNANTVNICGQSTIPAIECVSPSGLRTDFSRRAPLPARPQAGRDLGLLHRSQHRPLRVPVGEAPLGSVRRSTWINRFWQRLCAGMLDVAADRVLARVLDALRDRHQGAQ